MCYESDLFLAPGAARRLISSWVGIGLPWGIPKVFRRYVEGGLATYEEWSHLSLGPGYQRPGDGRPVPADDVRSWVRTCWSSPARR